MFETLEKYKVKGHFEFKPTQQLSQVCNTPKNSSGIYLIYADVVNIKKLIYIGISGRETSDGGIVHRLDGLGGRIVKGKQFGTGRRRSWPNKMKEASIGKLIVKWYVTYGAQDYDIPRPIERGFLETFVAEYGRLPIWNNET